MDKVAIAAMRPHQIMVAPTRTTIRPTIGLRARQVNAHVMPPAPTLEAQEDRPVVTQNGAAAGRRRGQDAEVLRRRGSQLYQQPPDQDHGRDAFQGIAQSRRQGCLESGCAPGVGGTGPSGSNRPDVHTPDPAGNEPDRNGPQQVANKKCGRDIQVWAVHRRGRGVSLRVAGRPVTAGP